MDKFKFNSEQLELLQRTIHGASLFERFDALAALEESIDKTFQQALDTTPHI